VNGLNSFALSALIYANIFNRDAIHGCRKAFHRYIYIYIVNGVYLEWSVLGGVFPHQGSNPASDMYEPLNGIVRKILHLPMFSGFKGTRGCSEYR
jgi:hypothetical protein